MLFGNYNFTCTFSRSALLPVYKGSTFRGVFGHALKKVVCALRNMECDTCLLKNKCLYMRVFETAGSVDHIDSLRSSALPHPFVIEPPIEGRTMYEKGETFTFNLILFGEVNNYLPYFIYAIEQMGSTGIGRRINGTRGKFTLEKVTARDRPIYSGVDQKLDMDNIFEDLNLIEHPEISGKSFRLRVEMITPLRLKFKNRLKADLPFHILTRAMLRRVSSLYSVYGDGEPDLDYRGLVKRAEEVQIVEETLHWYDWWRYSFRPICFERP